ncbi:MAG: SCO family protein [Alphaproteobacteria bacterium]|nr:SCO family protein [Alphaproteobacteria bacterium]
MRLTIALSSLCLALLLSLPAAQAVERAPFTLTDHTGKAVTDEDFLGSFLLVFFGYSHCPDVCPTDLAIMAGALDALGDRAAVVQPLFVTLDPERDTPEVLAAYLPAFHPRFIGLTGTSEQIAAMSESYSVRHRRYYPPPFDEDGEPREDDETYFVDHTAATYLVGPNGGALRLFHHGATVAEMITVIAEVLPTAR